MPKLGQHFHIPSGLVSETEVEPFMYFARMQAFLEYPLGELPRRHQGEIAPEGKHQHRINPRPLQPAKLLRQRCKQFRTRFRFQNSRRVRFERTATAFPPLARARNTISPSTWAWARWTPSKFPTLMNVGPKFAGTSSSL